jgi:hypothetical protein
MKKIVNVVCIKWGNAYDEEYINTLHHMIVRNTSYDVDFYCFTDDATGINKDIIIKPLPVLNTIKEYQTIHAYRKEAALCDDDLGGLKNKRVFFFDLDVVIISNLDEFFEYPEDDKFYIINDWNSKGNKIGQASSYSWVVGTLGYIKEYFEKNPKEVVDKFFTASQEYLSSKVIEKNGSLNFWPDDWFCSFRFHCMSRIGPLRHFITPKIPNNRPGLKVIVFHGMPNPREASKGIWKLKNKDKWKRLYKVCKPTKWVEKYWY